MTNAVQNIGVGAVANDGSGDPLRTAFQKINSNNAFVQHALQDNVSDQGPITGGVTVTSFNLGTFTGGSLIIDCGKCPLQYLINNGAFTIVAPAADGTCLIQVTNAASAGAITLSGFSANSPLSGVYSTTNGLQFLLGIVRINGVSSAWWAQQ